MNTLKRSLLFFYTETPLHAGSGAGLGAIDLPLQRERMSDRPQVQASGVKGALRELFRDDAHELALFGPRPPDPHTDKGDDETAKAKANEHAGALAVTDARLLLMPVRTAHGGWAWITSPIVLQRLARDLGCVEGTQDLPSWASLSVDSDSALVTASEVDVVHQSKLVIEDTLYNAKVMKSATVDVLIEVLKSALPNSEVYTPIRKRLRRQIAIISDEEMSYWARHGTEVVTRIRIDPATGTVADGALWTEEVLPSESLMWSMVLISKSRKPVQGKDNKPTSAKELDKTLAVKINGHTRIFLGGDRTVGRGLVALARKQGKEAHHA